MKKFLKWAGIVFAVMVILGIMFGKDNAGNTSAANNSAEPEKAAEPAVEVTASELLSAYKSNEVAANQQFKDKQLLVSATIDAIEAGIGDVPYLTLKAGGEYEFNKPQAHLASSEQSKAGSLSKGQKVKLLCTGNSEVAGTPMLADCIIQ